jgi:hypothetical protein
MSNWDERERLARALIMATRHEGTRDQRPVRVYLASDDDEVVVAFNKIGPGGFLAVGVISPEVEGASIVYINPDHIRSWYFADEEN